MAEGNSSHFSLKRGGVGRARKHAAYVIGAEKYASREDVLYVASGNMPAWAVADPLLFWEAADQHERANGRTYLEEEFAIPRELTQELAKNLVDSWIAKEFGNRHVWTHGIHSKPAEDGKPNIHCHLMFSDRILDGIERPPELFFRRPASRYRDRKTGELREPDPAKGGTGKDRRWNDRKLVKELRARWESYVNEFLTQHGHRPRLDLRSNAERGLDKPEPKIGPAKRRADRWREERLGDALAMRQRRRRTRDEIASIKSELREARRERARRDVCACEDVSGGRITWQQSPVKALTAERRDGRVVFRWSHGRAAGLVAVIDRGHFLSLAGKTSQPKVEAMIALAKAKGWKSIRLSGNDEFKRLAIRHALSEGLTVANPELAEIVSQLQKESSNHGNRSRKGVQQHSVHPEHSESWPLGVNSMEQTIDVRRLRIELAERWLAVAAPVDAIEAAKLRADPDKLLQVFDSLPEARRWELVESQRAQGVPDPLLGFEIDPSEPAGPFQGTVRHVGKRTWIEPRHRPGVVFPINALPLRPGQQIKRLPDGHVELLQSENTPQPR